MNKIVSPTNSTITEKIADWSAWSRAPRSENLSFGYVVKMTTATVVCRLFANPLLYLGSLLVKSDYPKYEQAKFEDYNADGEARSLAQACETAKKTNNSKLLNLVLKTSDKGLQAACQTSDVGSSINALVVEAQTRRNNATDPKLKLQAQETYDRIYTRLSQARVVSLSTRAKTFAYDPRTITVAKVAGAALVAGGLAYVAMQQMSTVAIAESATEIVKSTAPAASKGIMKFTPKAIELTTQTPSVVSNSSTVLDSLTGTCPANFSSVAKAYEFTTQTPSVVSNALTAFGSAKGTCPADFSSTVDASNATALVVFSEASLTAKLVRALLDYSPVALGVVATLGGISSIKACLRKDTAEVALDETPEVAPVSNETYAEKIARYRKETPGISYDDLIRRFDKENRGLSYEFIAKTFGTKRERVSRVLQGTR